MYVCIFLPIHYKPRHYLLSLCQSTLLGLVRMVGLGAWLHDGVDEGIFYLV